jgi:glutathione S-transferase
MLTLYDFAPSPHCVRVRVALALGGLRYHKVSLQLDGDQRRPAFRKLSPFATVPVLVDGRATLAQSYAALSWIGDRCPRLVGRGPARARVLTWLAVAATELDPPIRRAYDLAFFEPRGRAARDAALDDVRAMLTRLEAAHGRARWAAGPTPTLADAALFPSFWLLDDLVEDFGAKLPRRRWPRWDDWYRRFRARPEVARVIAEAD